MTTLNCPHCNQGFEIGIIPSPATQKPFIESKASDSIRNETKSDFKGVMVDANQAKQMRSKINIEGIVERKGEPRTINLKSGGTLATVDAFLTDDQGEIKLQLWGDDVDKISNGNKIRIENGYTNSYKGEVSLTKGKWGKLIIL